jgi:L-asparaginase
LALFALFALIASPSMSNAQNNLPVCPLIATGGTIAMKIDPVKKAPVPAISGEDLVATVPEVSKYARVEVNNVSNVPSDYMDPPRWIALTNEVDRALARPEVAGVIISHGTDTLEETAYWLDVTINSDKPVVLIGAQRNASEPDFDGPRNLLNAVRICVDVTKTHTSSVETFRSGDFGFLGIVDYDRIVYSRAPVRRQHVPINAGTMPYVEIVAMYGGADGQLIKATVDHGAKGIVVQGLGWGNVNLPMFAAIKEAIAKGVPVVITSRVPNGRVLPNYGFDGGGKTLVDAGAIMGDDLSPQKARILLMLLLQDGANNQKDVQKAFSR